MKLSFRKEKQLRRHKRVRSKISGDGDFPRLSVYRSNAHIFAQLIDDVKGETLAAASDLDKEFQKTKEKQKTKKDVAHKVGVLLAKKAATKKVTRVRFDRGGFLYIGRVRALAEGAREGGLKF